MIIWVHYLFDPPFLMFIIITLIIFMEINQRSSPMRSHQQTCQDPLLCTFFPVSTNNNKTLPQSKSKGGHFQYHHKYTIICEFLKLVYGYNLTKTKTRKHSKHTLSKQVHMVQVQKFHVFQNTLIYNAGHLQLPAAFSSLYTLLLVLVLRFTMQVLYILF